ncbi:MAG TPA: hypothetical protein VMF56_10635 [Acidobacteriaceae bacterium]|nr:hypothetical protein [Acidobacteriaceae bacterium]
MIPVFISAISLSYAFLDWEIYRQRFLLHPDGWMLYFSGGIQAPWQYRIGVWEAVLWLHQWFHLKPYDALTLIDVVCLALSLCLILRVLRHFEAYKTASLPMRWLATAGVLFLAEYYVVWGHWFQTEDTMPSILFVALSVALVCGELVQSRILACVLLVCLGWVEGFIRADVAVVLHAGFFLAVVFGKKTVPLGRAWQAATSLLAALAAGCVQLYLMRVRFPNAHYGAEGVVQLANNLKPEMWGTMLLTLLPFGILLALVVSKRYRPGAVTAMLLTSSLLYFPLWATVGLLDEVRIFLPFAFALMPATVWALIGLMPQANREN